MQEGQNPSTGALDCSPTQLSPGKGPVSYSSVTPSHQPLSCAHQPHWHLTQPQPTLTCLTPFPPTHLHPAAGSNPSSAHSRSRHLHGSPTPACSLPMTRFHLQQARGPAGSGRRLCAQTHQYVCASSDAHWLDSAGLFPLLFPSQNSSPKCFLLHLLRESDLGKSLNPSGPALRAPNREPQRPDWKEPSSSRQPASQGQLCYLPTRSGNRMLGKDTLRLLM